MKPSFLILTSLCFSFALPTLAEEKGAAHNVILILADDLGYGDLGVTGAEGYDTPHLDQLAREGVLATHYYAVSPVCSASRAALLTSRYPPRTGVLGVIGATKPDHLPLEEVTLAERFREHGYATAIFGKWHLGNHVGVWPLEQGFDEWQGTVGSNDMGRDRPSLEARRAGKAGVEWVINREVTEIDPDQSLLTRRTTDLALDFIQRHEDQPFFLYLPLNMPHTPLFASESFRGSTQRGLYGDVISEIDDAVGRIRKELVRRGLLDKTLFAFASDNGPWLIFGDEGGSNHGLSGGKKQTLEGGMRVPLIVRGPGVVPGIVDARLSSGLDLGPTLASLAGIPWDEAQQVDGRDLSSRWTGGKAQEIAEKPFFYFYDREVRAIRLGPWKLQLEHTDAQTPNLDRIGYGGERGEVMKVPRPEALYHLGYDPGEQMDRAEQFPEKVKELQDKLDVANAIAETPLPQFLLEP